MTMPFWCVLRIKNSKIVPRHAHYMISADILQRSRRYSEAGVSRLNANAHGLGLNDTYRFPDMATAGCSFTPLCQGGNGKRNLQVHSHAAMKRLHVRSSNPAPVG